LSEALATLPEDLVEDHPAVTPVDLPEDPVALQVAVEAL
jgi:hypothetical protein